MNDTLKVHFDKSLIVVLTFDSVYTYYIDICDRGNKLRGRTQWTHRYSILHFTLKPNKTTYFTCAVVKIKIPLGGNTFFLLKNDQTSSF